MADEADRAAVEALLGRPVQGDFEVVVRHDDGSPVVLCNAPLLRDGTPIASAATAIGPRGAVRAELRPPAGSFGLATVRLLAIGWDPKQGAPRTAEPTFVLHFRSPPLQRTPGESAAGCGPGGEANAAHSIT